MGLGMSTTYPSLLRDASACAFSYCAKGLRDCSVMSILAENVEICEHTITSLLSLMKGRAERQAALVRYARWSALPSPIDLLVRWGHARGSHARFYTLLGERTDAGSGALNRCLQRCISALHLRPPAVCSYSPHSLRIGTHTEQVLVGIPLEVRLARFGWGPNSESITALYFDRTFRVSSASAWFFWARDFAAFAKAAGAAICTCDWL